MNYLVIPLAGIIVLMVETVLVIGFNVIADKAQRGTK